MGRMPAGERRPVLDDVAGGPAHALLVHGAADVVVRVPEPLLGGILNDEDAGYADGYRRALLAIGVTDIRVPAATCRGPHEQTNGHADQARVDLVDLQPAAPRGEEQP